MNKEKIANLNRSFGIMTYDPLELMNSIENLVAPAYTNVDKGHDLNHVYNVINSGIKIQRFLRDSDKNFVWNVKLENDLESNDRHDDKRICRLIILAGYLHDVYSYTKRETHSEEAYKLCLGIYAIKKAYINREFKSIIDKMEKLLMSKIPGQSGSNWNSNNFSWLNFYSLEDISIVANMVKEHRASNQEAFSSTYSELFSAADRGDLNLEVVISRIYHSKNKKDIVAMDSLTSDNYPMIVRNLVDIDNPFTVDQKVMTKAGIKSLWEDYGFTNHMVAVFYHLIEKFAQGGYMYKKLSLNSIYMTYHKDNIREFWNEIESMYEDPSLFIPYYVSLSNQ